MIFFFTYMAWLSTILPRMHPSFKLPVDRKTVCYFFTIFKWNVFFFNVMLLMDGIVNVEHLSWQRALTPLNSDKFFYWHLSSYFFYLFSPYWTYFFNSFSFHFCIYTWCFNDLYFYFFQLSYDMISLKLGYIFLILYFVQIRNRFWEVELLHKTFNICLCK